MEIKKKMNQQTRGHVTRHVASLGLGPQPVAAASEVGACDPVHPSSRARARPCGRCAVVLAGVEPAHRAGEPAWRPELAPVHGAVPVLLLHQVAVQRAVGAGVQARVHVAAGKADHGDAEAVIALYAVVEQEGHEQVDQREVLAQDWEETVEHDLDVAVVHGPRVDQHAREGVGEDRVLDLEELDNQDDLREVEAYVEQVVDRVVLEVDQLEVLRLGVDGVQLEARGHGVHGQDQKAGEQAPYLELARGPRQRPAEVAELRGQDLQPLYQTYQHEQKAETACDGRDLADELPHLVSHSIHLGHLERSEAVGACGAAVRGAVLGALSLLMYW